MVVVVVVVGGGPRGGKRNMKEKRKQEAVSQGLSQRKEKCHGGRGMPSVAAAFHILIPAVGTDSW